MNLDKKQIAQILKEARKKAGLTQFELAEKVGMSDKHISKIETGMNYPSLDNFLNIIEVLDLSLSDFGFKTAPDDYPSKRILQKIINTSSEQQLDTYVDVILAVKKHFS